ncbi:Initiator protein NS1 like protein [Argiope bruennichi]|uniref:Initiator protein NS1 like protein n=1 Tax=Argiope bruennichi TaxID=94029 RepID=A0A8T0FDL3_ARGBR|nr:Initiator protein NS1 like protein [Argiope bruennichi]
METTFAYRAIVFGIKEEHPAGDEECEYRELHYHGLIEHPEKYRFDSDRVINELKPLCTFFKSEIAKLPVNFLAYLNLPPRNVIYEIVLENSDLPCLQAQVTPELINEVKERKLKRINEKREGSNDIMKIKEFIILTKCFSATELLNEMCKKPHLKKEFEMIYCKRTYDCNFKKALNFAVQETLDKYFLDLAAEFVDDKNECMSPYHSADIMDQWIKFQGIDPQEFCFNMLHLLDHKHRKLNCIILQGAPNSGKTSIAKSLEKATICYAEVTQAVAGYSFMWMDCINKRLIVINEPFFSSNSIEELKMVLEGTGCRVKCKGKGDEYLRPTPVLITSNVDVWCQCPEAKDAILARCLKLYDNLKPCPFLKNVYKDLHPRWLSILLIRYAKQVPGEIKFLDSDDECDSPPPSQGTAARVLTSQNKIKPEDPSTNSTDFVESTTSRPRHWAPLKPTKTSSEKLRLRAGGETSSPELSQRNHTYDNSLDTNSYLEKASLPPWETPKGSLKRLLNKEQTQNNLHHPKKADNKELYGEQTVKKDLNKQFAAMGSHDRNSILGSLQPARADPTPTTSFAGGGGSATDSDVNMTPVSTGTVKLFFQRIFWHYFSTPASYQQCPKNLDDNMITGLVWKMNFQSNTMGQFVSVTSLSWTLGSENLNNGCGKLCTKSMEMALHKTVAKIEEKLKASGKWDPKRAAHPYSAGAPSRRQASLDDYIATTEVGLRDISEAEEQELAPLFEQAALALEEEEAAGKPYHMSYNVESNSNLFAGNQPATSECNSEAISKATTVDMQIQLENEQSNISRPLCDINFPILYEGRNLSNKIRETNRPHKINEISKRTGVGEGTTGISEPKNNVRDKTLIYTPNCHPLTFNDFKKNKDFGDLNQLEAYFQSYNSIGIVIKCLPDDTFNSYEVFTELCKFVNDPFILISEQSKEGVLHWHMIWLTSKRTDNAKRSLQTYLKGISENFSIACQQTRSLKHLLRYILKEPLSIGIANSNQFMNYCCCIFEQCTYEEPKDVPSNPMVKDILQAMTEHNEYTLEGLLRVAPTVMLKYLHKPSLDTVVNSCKLFCHREKNVNSILQRALPGWERGSCFRIWLYLSYQGINPGDFFMDMWNILFRTSGKINVCCLYGQSNSGKTTFIRPLLNIFTFGEVVSGGQFMFQNCINKELLIWEEPLIGPDYVEMCKRVFEGMTTQVPVKFKPAQTLYRTPLLITTNKSLWYYCSGDEAALSNRLVQYDFNKPAQNFHLFVSNYASSVTDRLQSSLEYVASISASVSQPVQQGLQLIGQRQAAQAVGSLNAFIQNVNYAVPYAVTNVNQVINVISGGTTKDETAATEARTSTAPTHQDLQSTIAPQLTTSGTNPELQPEIPIEVEESPQQSLEFIHQTATDLSSLLGPDDPEINDLLMQDIEELSKGLNFAVQETLDKYYLDLAAEYVDDKGECISPYQSADLMDQWLKFQSLDPQEFCYNFLHLMDHKHRKLNSIILQGAPNSGKTYIAKSLEKACIFYAEVTQAVAGYSFMWMDCINKRLIVINEPFFSNNSIEELKMVLEGTGCRVKCKGKGDEYLRPTPVLITSNVDVWCQCPEAKDAILARCLKLYNNLKPCPFLKNVYKDLHPRYCGPGTNIEEQDLAGGPVSELDRLCRKHDIETELLGTTKADENFIREAPATGWWGNFFANHHANPISTISPGTIPPGENEPTNLGNTKRKQETPPQGTGIGQPPPPKKANNKEEYGGTTVKKDLNHQFAEMGDNERNTLHGATQPRAEPTPTTAVAGGGSATDSDVNMTPVSTGTVKLFFQRIFWHYFSAPSQYEQSPKGLDDNMITGWSHIPYEHICSAINPRQWQYINIAAKRWRVLSFGFKASHFIPFKNDIKSDGGAVGPTISYMVNSSLQTYIDKGYQLPVLDRQTLPNNNMAYAIGNQTNSKLNQITWPRYIINGQWDENTSYKAYVESQMMPLMNIEQSNEFEILPNDGIFSFEHTLKPHELKWRHGLYPTNADKVSNAAWGANPLGRWDGGIAIKNQQDEPNCLTFLCDVKEQIDQIWYQCAIKYHAWIELDMTTFLSTPVWLREYKEVNNDNAWDIFNTSAARTTRDAELQCCGSNAIPIIAGPKPGEADQEDNPPNQ